MKMNVGELKANLSRVLRVMRASGERVVVCVREEPVAYLTPAGTGDQPSPEEHARTLLSATGLRVSPPALSGHAPMPVAHVAGDGQRDVSTIEAIREEKEW